MALDGLTLANIQAFIGCVGCPRTRYGDNGMTPPVEDLTASATESMPQHHGWDLTGPVVLDFLAEAAA